MNIEIKETVEKCQEFCVSTSGCKYFTFNKVTNECKLKSSQGTRLVNRAIISGAKSCPAQSDSAGKAWCKDACLATPDCNFYTWTKFRGRQMCYSLSQCVENSDDDCFEAGMCSSGEKYCLEGIPCQKIEDPGPKFLDWQCHDPFADPVDGYAEDIPLAQPVFSVVNLGELRGAVRYK